MRQHARLAVLAVLLGAPVPFGAAPGHAEGSARAVAAEEQGADQIQAAGEEPGSKPAFRHREKSPDAPPLPKIEFYCTDSQGARRELGELLCIRTGCRSILARCEMSLNNPIWRELQEGCPAAALISPAPGAPTGAALC